MAKEVATASSLTPKPKKFIDKHGSKLVIANKVVGAIASNIDSPQAKDVAKISKTIGEFVPKKKEKKD